VKELIAQGEQKVIDKAGKNLATKQHMIIFFLFVPELVK
jgi:hypothetical protein